MSGKYVLSQSYFLNIPILSNEAMMDPSTSPKKRPICERQHEASRLLLLEFSNMKIKDHLRCGGLLQSCKTNSKLEWGVHGLKLDGNKTVTPLLSASDTCEASLQDPKDAKR